MNKTLTEEELKEIREKINYINSKFYKCFPEKDKGLIFPEMSSLKMPQPPNEAFCYSMPLVKKTTFIPAIATLSGI